MEKRAAIYVRVSTDKQTTNNQLTECDRLARARGYDYAGMKLFEETESAAKARPVFEALRARVRAGEFSAVFVWALDRLGRSMVGVVNDVLEFERCGAPVFSVRESWLNTDGPVRSLLVAIFGWVAEQERTRLIDRTRAGLERARREGKQLGRPRASPVLLLSAAELLEKNPARTVASAARAVGVRESTLRDFLRRRRNEKGGRG